MGRTALSSLNPEMSIKSLALISLCNFLSNEPPLPKVVRLELNKYLAELFKILDVSYPADTRFFFATTHPLDRPGWGLHEDIAQNPEHTALIFVSFFMLLCRKKTRLQSIFLINFFAAGTLFCILLTWQPWITRLQVPLFILGAPLTALALGKIQFARKPVSVVVIVLSLLPLFFNTSRQLAPFKAKTWTIWNKNRGELYFSNRRDLYEAYKQAINAIKINKSQKIGIMLGVDSWEYPLWLALRNEFPHATIEHISANNSVDSKNFDTIFVLDRVDARSMLPDSRIINNPDVIFLPPRKIEQTHRSATSPINSE